MPYSTFFNKGYNCIVFMLIFNIYPFFIHNLATISGFKSKTNLIFETSAKNCIGWHNFQQKIFFMKTRLYSPREIFPSKKACGPLQSIFHKNFFLLKIMWTNAVFCTDFKYEICFAFKSRYCGQIMDEKMINVEN